MITPISGTGSLSASTAPSSPSGGASTSATVTSEYTSTNADGSIDTIDVYSDGSTVVVGTTQATAATDKLFKPDSPIGGLSQLVAAFNGNGPEPKLQPDSGLPWES